MSITSLSNSGDCGSMAWWCRIIIFCFIYVNLLAVFVNSEEVDLYEVIGVDRSATQAQIKKAYKQLAKAWHPDKNQEDGAHEKFLKINEAYEILSNKEKRAEYDRFGYHAIGPEPHGFRHGGFPFEGFFDGGFNFNSRSGGSGSSDRYRITYRSYELNVLPESRTRPYLIYAYANFCFECLRIQNVWERVTQDLNAIGMGIGTFSVDDDSPLRGVLKVHYVPSIIAVINGRVTHVRGDFGVQQMREYIRKLFPRSLITKLTDSNYKQFVNGWHDNRVRALFFSNRDKPSLRFVLMAYAFRERIAAGYVQLDQKQTAEMRMTYGVRPGLENLLILNEDTAMPVASVAMPIIARSIMDEMAEKNKYLQLPRISSPAVFNEICPPHSKRMVKVYCVILISRNNPQHSQYRASFLQFTHNYTKPVNKFRFAYVFEDSQSEFVSAVTRGHNTASKSSLKITVLWRDDLNKVHFDYMEKGWLIEKTGQSRSGAALTSKLEKLKKDNSVKLPFSTEVPTITDEHVNGIFVRIWLKLQDWADTLVEYIMDMDGILWATGIFSICVMIFLSVVMHWAANIEQDNVTGTGQAKKDARERFCRRELNMHPFNTKSYKNLVGESPQGHITILLLLTEESKEKLLNKFAEYVFQYSSSVYMRFAFLELEKYLPWYTELLEETLEFKKQLNINCKNCTGTVLAINGYRKYYTVYHSKAVPTHWRRENVNSTSEGGFLGMEDSESDDDDGGLGKYEDVLLESDLLEGLPNWMDRVYEGSVKRFHVNYWPKLTPTNNS